MGTNDNLLNELVSILSEKTLYAAYTEDDYNPQPDDVALPSEVGNRVEMSSITVDNSVTFSGIRSGASVVGATGDTLRGTALFNASTNGEMQAQDSLPGIIHTTNFDIEAEWEFSVVRRS